MMKKSWMLVAACMLVAATAGYAQEVTDTVRQHVRIEPDEAKLREFYKTAHPEAKDLDKSPEYWSWVMEAILENGDFGWTEQEARKKYYTFWIGVTEDKCPESDDVQIGLAKLHYGADRDSTKRAERLDAQFNKHQKPGDWRRILKWVKAYKNDWQKKQEYTAKIDYKTAGIEGIEELVNVLCNELNESYLARRTFKKICENIPFEETSGEDVRRLIVIAGDTMGDGATARMLAEKLNLDKTPEAEKLALAREFLKMDESMGEAVYSKLEDQGAAKMELLKHYETAGNTEKALELIGELAKIDKYADVMSLKYAEMLQAVERYTEAIEAYKLADKPPATLWRIVECYVAMEDIESAVAQLREIETAYEDQEKKAVYRIACLYHDAEAAKEAFAVWKEIIEKFPFSKEAERAKEELEKIPPREPEEIILHF